MELAVWRTIGAFATIIVTDRRRYLPQDNSATALSYLRRPDQLPVLVKPEGMVEDVAVGEQNPDQESDDTKKRDRQWIATVVVAILGLAGTILAGWLGASATTDSIATQLSDQRAASDRARRAEVYAEFLKAANAQVSNITAADECNNRAETKQSQAPAPAPGTLPTMVGGYKECIPYYDARSAGVDALLAAYVQVYVWGSSDAVSAAKDVQSALSDTGGPPDPMAQPAYDRFLSVMCRELPAVPRADC